MKHLSLSFYFIFFLPISVYIFASLTFFLAHVLSIPPAPTGVYPLQPLPLRPLSHIQPCVPRVFQISRLAPQYDNANPPSRQLRKFTRDEFLSCDTFLLFFFFFLLPLGTFILVLLQ